MSGPEIKTLLMRVTCKNCRGGTDLDMMPCPICGVDGYIEIKEEDKDMSEPAFENALTKAREASDEVLTSIERYADLVGRSTNEQRQVHVAAIFNRLAMLNVTLADLMRLSSF